MSDRLELAYQRARMNPEYEAKDLCSIPAERLEQALKEASEPSPEWERATVTPVGAAITGGGTVLKEIDGMGRVYDWRTSAWTPANGGRIDPLIFVQHIPVISNQPGIADFVRLRDVLVSQGLMVQTATDREGNVALFTPFDALCYHARGANQFSAGCEHMHATTGEDWSRKQLRASAWIAQLFARKHDIRVRMADLEPGNGVCRVARTGHTSHENVSRNAGYNDRSDPGPGYDYEYVRHCAWYFGEHGHMRGA